jgi:hypothetical protein
MEHPRLVVVAIIVVVFVSMVLQLVMQDPKPTHDTLQKAALASKSPSKFAPH